LAAAPRQLPFGGAPVDGLGIAAGRVSRPMHDDTVGIAEPAPGIIRVAKMGGVAWHFDVQVARLRRAAPVRERTRTRQAAADPPCTHNSVRFGGQRIPAASDPHDRPVHERDLHDLTPMV